MPDWMKDLEKLVKGFGRDEDEGDEEGGEDEEGDEEEEDETPAPKPRARKSAAGVCDPKANAETTNSGGEPGVHDPKSLDRRSGGGAAPVRKSLEDVVSEDAADAMEVSSVLGEIAKGINTLAGQNSAEVAGVSRRLVKLEKSMDAIGVGLVKGLTLQVATAKSLREDVEEIGKQPAGRKSIAKGIERKFEGNEENTASVLPTANEIMAKSLKAIKAGAINAHQASMLETARQQGKWAEVAGIWERCQNL